MDKVIDVKIDSLFYGTECVIENIDFSISKGELVVITGFSGCGKTSLLRVLTGLVPSLYEGSLAGEIKVLGKPVNKYEQGEIAKYIGQIFQNPNEQFFSDNVRDEIALVAENLGMEHGRMVDRVNRAIDAIDIQNLSDKLVNELSGGEKQKVAIASSLVYDNEIIIFDEPSSSLDYEAIQDLKEIIIKLKESGKTIVVAEHRLYYLTDILDKLFVMNEGKIKNIYRREDLTEEIRLENNLRAFREKGLKATREFRKDKNVIEIRDLRIENKGFKKNYLVDFSLCHGECMGVLGDNGSGKTTLAKQLVGLFDINKGSVSFGRKKKERLKKASIVLQNSSSIFFHESVEKELINKEQVKDGEYLERVKNYLVEMELWDKRGLNPQDLSGGEKQRLAIIIAMLKEADVLILDEPTSGLDFKRMNLVSQSLIKYSEQSPVIMITHDLEVLFKTCNTVLMLGENCVKKIEVKGNEEKISEFLESNMEKKRC